MAGVALPRGIRARGEAFIVDVSRGGSRKTATCSTIEQAKAKRQQLLQELSMRDQGLQLHNAAWTLKKAFEVTVDIAWRGARAEKDHIKNARYALNFFGEATPITSIDTDWVDSYAKALETSGNADATINRKLSSLSKMLSVAVDRHVKSGLSHRPKISFRKERNSRDRFVYPAEEEILRRLFAQWSKTDHLDVLVCLLQTGARVDSELFQIEVRDVDFRTRNIILYGKGGDGTKNGDSRAIPMTSEVLDIMRRRCAGRAAMDKVFPYYHSWFRAQWDRARAMMGLVADKGFTPHACRHSFASRLVQRGVPILVVQKLLGHKRIEMTMRYAHLAPTNLADAISLLERKDRDAA